MKHNKINGFLPLRRMKWVFAVSAAVVVGSVLIFGLIGYYAFDFNGTTAIYMLGMIIPMTVIIGMSMHLIMKHMEKHLMPLLDALEDVSNGNLDIQLDAENADEYEKIYRGFNDMTNELKATKHEMDNFVNAFSHEFKTPITSINGFADYLYETGGAIETEERLQYLKVISEQSHRLANLTQNILLLSKLEACRIVTDKDDFSLSEQIKSCAILLLKQIEEKNITLNIPEDIDIGYYGNEELLEQVWLNILSNSIKFTPQNGAIDIEESIRENAVVIRISDNGIGMTEETQKHLFDKYYQNDTKNFKNGNGIGLAITKRIIDLCNGTVEVESRLDEGSSFTITLPVQR